MDGYRVWLRDLLESMVLNDLLSKDKFEQIDAEVTLVAVGMRFENGCIPLP